MPVHAPLKSQTGYGEAGGVIWSPGGALEIGITLPGWARKALRREDVDVILLIEAPGCDRVLEPVIRLDFGVHAEGALLQWPVDGAAAMSQGVRLRLPRGLTGLSLRPHTGPFTARGLSCRLVPARPPRGRYERVLFEVSSGSEGGLGRLKSRGPMVDADAVHTGNLVLDIRSGTFHATTSDPHVVFELDAPVGMGWWRIDARMAVNDEARPRVYAAHEGAFSETHSCELALRGPGHFTGYLCLDGLTRQIRFDPSCRGGESGSMHRLSMRPASPAEVAVAALRPSVWQATRTIRASRALLSHLAAPRWAQGHFALPVRLPAENTDRSQDGDAYKSWIERHDYHPDKDNARYREALAGLETQPLVSVVMPVYKTPIELLDAAIRSVRDQLYTNWELCIADDASGDGKLAARLRYWMKTDARIKVVSRETNGNISAATNSAFELVEGEWVALLDHDDVLRPHALAELVLTAAARPDAQLIYSDEDKIDDRGERYGPYFKPAFSPDLFYGQNYLNHLTAHRAENIRAAGGWREGFEGSQDYDLNLRILERIGPEAVVHIPKILYHWRAVAGSTAVAVGEKSYAWEAGQRALQEHFARREAGVTVGQVEGYPYYEASWPLPEEEPLVSLVIPTRDGADLVKMCVESILERSTYQNYEILIVDNQSSKPETFALFEALTARDPRVRVLTYNKPFNFSAINNFAIAQARGEIVGLINNDIEVITPDWLEQMVSLVVREDVGCVGAMLYYPDDRIQHAGVVIGIGGVAGHSHKYFERGAQGYFARLKLVHDVSAVTGACLLVRKSVYDEVGGLNEEKLTIAFNDVDFCLKVREAGYRNLFTPRAELYHHESVSRGHEDTPEKKARFRSEVEYMLSRWATDVTPDPFYSPHLSRTHEDFRILED